LIRNACLLLAAGAFACFASLASAQDTSAVPFTPLQKQLSRLDFSVSGIGQFSKSVSGPVQPADAPDYCSSYPPASATAQNCGSNVISEAPSSTLGALVGFRYTYKPLIGIEFNYTYARYTETFNDVTTATTLSPGQIQTGVDEASFGYVIAPKRQFMGLQPFASAGAGSTRFKPTSHGGQGAPIQWRATYYYSIGVEDNFGGGHFGVRAAFRQAFFKAPDFLLNYLTINQHTYAIEPTIGFFVRF
jgi:hypothetical protein